MKEKNHGMDLLTNLSLFSGAGGLDLGAKLVGGFRTVCYVENDRYAQGVLMSRMRSGDLDDAPIFEDVRTFDGRSLAGSIDVVSGGFPCQDVSNAGKRGGLKEGNRSGLWHEFARIICEVKPRFVLVENVGGLLSIDDGRGFGIVLGDMAAVGFDAEWFVLSAADVGAPHQRERVWVVAYANELSGAIRRDDKADAGEGRGGGDHARGSGTNDRRESDSRQNAEVVNADSTRRQRFGRSGANRDSEFLRTGEDVADSDGIGCVHGQPQEQPRKTGFQTQPNVTPCGDTGTNKGWDHFQPESPSDDRWWKIEPNVGRVVNEVAFRVDRLRCTGNGVVPQQSAPAWQKIKDIVSLT